jgi:hypothetical protein
MLESSGLRTEPCGAPLQRCIPSPLFQVSCLEEVPDETNEAFVIYVPTKYINQYFVVEAVETLRNISFDKPLRALASVSDLL